MVIIWGARTMLLLTKGKNCTKNLSQAVNFKPVSLLEILSDKDKQGIMSEWPRKATSLTRPIFDEKRMKWERGAQQSMTGLQTWLCYIEITVIWNIFLPFFSHHDHAFVCKHKCFLASMFYQNIGPSGVHVFHMYGVYFSSKKPVIF
jgi:hypothetical protein